MTKTLISRQARVLTRTIVSGFGQLQLVMVMARTATEPAEPAHSSRSPAVPLSTAGESTHGASRRRQTDQQLCTDYV